MTTLKYLTNFRRVCARPGGDVSAPRYYSYVYALLSSPFVTLTTPLYEITTITVTVNDYRATVRYAAAFAVNGLITHGTAHVDNRLCVCARVICSPN